MNKNPLRRQQSLGPSVWLDSVRRGLLGSGDMARLLNEESVSGIAATGAGLVVPAKERRESLALEDVRNAADLLRSIYSGLHAADGYVCFELPADVAHDTRAALAEARRLFRAIGRPNVMITIPATREGLLVSRQLLAEGINVNVSLLFGPSRYREVVDSYLYGLEEALLSNGKSLASVASVASFFVSPIDACIDPLLGELIQSGGAKAGTAALLRGEVAIASAKAAYAIYAEVFESERFRRLASRGARPQRLLWCATSPANPAYSELKYVEALIGPDTVTALALKTIAAYREHGDPAPRLLEDAEHAREVLASLSDLAIDLDDVTEALQDQALARWSAREQRLEETVAH